MNVSLDVIIISSYGMIIFLSASFVNNIESVGHQRDIISAYKNGETFWNKHVIRR